MKSCDEGKGPIGLTRFDPVQEDLAELSYFPPLS